MNKLRPVKVFVLQVRDRNRQKPVLLRRLQFSSKFRIFVNQRSPRSVVKMWRNIASKFSNRKTAGAAAAIAISVAGATVAVVAKNAGQVSVL
jgi:hypothetical protein